MLIEKKPTYKRLMAMFILYILNFSISIFRIFYFKIYRKKKSKNTKSIKEKKISRCIECGSELSKFFLPLDNYEKQFCERCKFGDFESIV